MVEQDYSPEKQIVGEGLTDEWDEVVDEQDDGDDGLFPGDTGSLPAAARRVLVQLLRSSYISYDNNAKDWSYLIECRSSIKSVLNDLFLELFVDMRNEIAYCLPVETAGDSFLKLKREHELTETQSLLIVFLRQQYASQTSGGAENVWIDGKDIYEYLERLFSEGTVNHVQSAKTINSSIEYMRKQHYIEPVRGVSDRYRVLPIIETAFPLEKIQKVLEAYEQDAAKRSQAAEEQSAAKAEEDK